MRLIVAAVVLWVSGSAAAATQATLPLAECLLQHPLRLDTVTARCATLEVPLDRSAPAGPSIALRVAVVPALNRSSGRPPLFLLAGGPGQSAVDLYVSHAGAFTRIRRDHDIVLLDQRGTGASTPLFCDFPAEFSVDSPATRQLEEATAACLRKFGERVRFFNSSAAVVDLDQVRAALGYAKISLYGASYGTRMAELYMRRYAPFVDAVILDGVLDPQQPIGPQTPIDGERALRLIITRCNDNRACAEAFPQLGAELHGLLDRFGPQRLPLKLADPSTGTLRDVEFDHDLLASALRLMSYSSAQAALLPALIHQAALGDFGALAAQSLMLTQAVETQVASGMQMSVICSEDEPLYPPPGADRSALAATYQGADQIEALTKVCARWPRGPVDADLHAPLRSDVPTLLLSGEADPVTPPSAAERAAAGLTRHRHLILAGEGHGQLGTGCVPRLMAEFLDHPNPERLDTGCLAAHRAAAFFVSPTGPAP